MINNIKRVGFNYAWRKIEGNSVRYSIIRNKKNESGVRIFCFFFCVFTMFGFRSLWSTLKPRESLRFCSVQSKATNAPNLSLIHLFFFFSFFFFLWTFLFASRLRCSLLLRVFFLLNTTEGTRLHRCVPLLAVFFLASAWSGHPSRTAGPDEELEKLHLAASHLRCFFFLIPREPTPPPPPTVSYPDCSFENKGNCQERESIIVFGPRRYI